MNMKVVSVLYSVPLNLSLSIAYYISSLLVMLLNKYTALDIRITGACPFERASAMHKMQRYT